jgi:hypothetical protein
MRIQAFSATLVKEKKKQMAYKKNCDVRTHPNRKIFHSWQELFSQV